MELWDFTGLTKQLGCNRRKLATHKCCMTSGLQSASICQVALAPVAQDLLESEQTSHGSSVRKLSPFWRWLLPELPRHHALTSPEQHIPLACPSWELKCSVSLARSQSLPLSCFWQHQTLRRNLAVIEFQKSGKYKQPKSHVYTYIYIIFIHLYITLILMPAPSRSNPKALESTFHLCT